MTAGAEGAHHCFRAAGVVYESTIENDRGLRDIVVETINAYLRETVKSNEWNQGVLKEVPALAFDLVCKRAE